MKIQKYKFGVHTCIRNLHNKLYQASQVIDSDTHFNLQPNKNSCTHTLAIIIIYSKPVSVKTKITITITLIFMNICTLQTNKLVRIQVNHENITLHVKAPKNNFEIANTAYV